MARISNLICRLICLSIGIISATPAHAVWCTQRALNQTSEAFYLQRQQYNALIEWYFEAGSDRHLSKQAYCARLAPLEGQIETVLADMQQSKTRYEAITERCQSRNRIRDMTVLENNLAIMAAPFAKSAPVLQQIKTVLSGECASLP